MDEKILVEATRTLVTFTLNQLTSEGKKLFKEINNELSSFLGQAVQNYLIKQIEKYSLSKTFLHGNTPIFFYQFYYPLKLIKTSQDRIYRNLSANRLRSLKLKNLDLKIIETEDINKLFEESNFISLIGDAGSGKSTLVRHIFFQTILTKYAIPLLIELRYLNDFNGNIEDYLTQKLLDTKITSSNRILERLLEQGKFIIFFDGYDEIKSSIKNKITKGLYEFTEKYNNNKYILTARPYSNIESLPNFHNYYLKDLEDKEIYEFIDKQLKSQKELADKIKQSIKGSKSEYIDSFLTNPLLLSLYILTFQNNPSIPSKKYIFYGRVIEALFSEHDSRSKIGFNRERLSNLTQEEFEKVLQVFCFITFFDNRFDFEKDYLINKLSLTKSKIPNIDFLTESFISDMKVSVGLWTEDNGIYSFAHRSLQEYFAALFLKNLNEDIKKTVYRKKIIEHSKIPLHFNLTNFLSLLEEMDTYDYYNLLLLPLLKKVHSKMDKKTGIGLIEIAFKLFFKEIIIRRINKGKSFESMSIRPSSLLSHFDYCFDKIELELFRIIFSKARISIYNDKLQGKKTLEFSNTKLNIDEKKYLAVLMKETKIEKVLIKFKTSLIKKISLTEEYINEHNKSNEDIIDLI